MERKETPGKMEYKYKVEVNGMWIEASAFLEPAATELGMWQVNGLALADDGTLQVTPAVAVADEKELRDKGMNWNREYTFEIHVNGNYYIANQDSSERVAVWRDGVWERLSGTSQAELQERFGPMLAGFDHIDGTDFKISGDSFGIDSLGEHLFVGLNLKVTDNWMIYTTRHDNLGVVQEAVVEAVGLEGDQIIKIKVAVADLNFSGTRIYAKGSSGLFAAGGYDLLSKMTPGTAIIARIDIDGMSRVIPDRKDIVCSDLYDYCTSQYWAAAVVYDQFRPENQALAPLYSAFPGSKSFLHVIEQARIDLDQTIFTSLIIRIRPG